MILVLGAEAGRTVRQLIARQDRLTRERVIVVLAFAAVLPSIFGISHTSRQLSRGTDASMLSNFQQHEAEFRHMVALAQHDALFTRIAPDSPPTPAYVPGSEKHASRDTLTAERWEEYRTNLRATDVRNGIWISENGQRVGFSYWYKPLILDGYVKGYIYSAHPLEPAGTTRRPGWFYIEKSDLEYRQIADGWYLYDLQY